ncbi:MAG TPA: universal stress protein [Terracidiphilus sp.]|nr:universal stress protein [Terracidiphilus sp.]
MEERENEWVNPGVILVATDLSDLDRLMPFAMEQAKENNARLLLLHVLNAGGSLSADPAGMPYYDTTGAIDFAQKTLEPWRTLARQHQVACDILVREGIPAQQIAASVRQFQIGRILLGTRSRNKVRRLFLGSVAEQVLRSVNLPVITVGPEAHLEVENSDSEKVVLHATTLRETSRPSAVLACRIAAQQHAKLVMLHVQPQEDAAHAGSNQSTIEDAARHEIQRLAEQCGAFGTDRPTKVEICVVHGNPSIEILATAAQLHASLILLGATHRSVLQNLTRDRTIYRVLAHARCPVLTIREPASVSVSSEHEVLASHQ